MKVKRGRGRGSHGSSNHHSSTDSGISDSYDLVEAELSHLPAREHHLNRLR